MITGFKIDALGEGWHFSTCQVDSAFDFTCAVTEFEHVGVILTIAVFESGDDGDGVELLSIEKGIIGELVIDLMDGERNDGFMIDWLVLFLARIHLIDSRLD